MTTDRSTENPGENESVVPLGDRGRLVLPAEIRYRLGLKQGDRLLVHILDDNSLQLTNLRREISKVRGILKPTGKKKSLAVELVKERKKEQARDDRRS